MTGVFTSIDFDRRRVFVQTTQSIEFAKKVALLALLDANLGVREFMTSLIFERNGKKGYLLSW